MISKQANELFRLNTTEMKSIPLFIKNWQSNLALMIIEETLPNAQSVLIQLGDILWSNYHLISAAHICYLLAGLLIIIVL